MVEDLLDCPCNYASVFVFVEASHKGMRLSRTSLSIGEYSSIVPVQYIGHLLFADYIVHDVLFCFGFQDVVKCELRFIGLDDNTLVVREYH